MQGSKTWTAAVTVIGALLASGCGGGGDDVGDDGFQPLGVEALQPSLGNEENPLPLTDPDVALAAALAALVAGSQLSGSDYLDFDLLGGSGSADCDSGFIDQSGGTASGVADFSLQATQCYFDIPEDDEEVVLDGRLDVLATTGSGGSGEVVLGDGTDSFVGAYRGAGQDRFAFVQLIGRIGFSTPDPAADFSSTRDANLILGRAVPDRDGRVRPSRFFEVASGLPATAFEIDRYLDTDEIGVFGPVALRGSGLATGCNVRGAVSVDTHDLIAIADTVDGLRFSRGQLSVSTAAGTALVTFDASGGAIVDLPSGDTADYSPGEVESLCGMDF